MVCRLLIYKHYHMFLLLVIYLFIGLLLAVPPMLCVVLYGWADSSVSYTISLGILLIALTTLYFWKQATRSFFDPFVLFIVAVLLFNGGHAILEVLGLSGPIGGILAGDFSKEITAKVLLMVYSSLFFLGLGGLAAAIRPQAEAAPVSPFMEPALRRVGWWMIGIAILPSFYILATMVKVYLTGGYLSLYQPNPALDAANKFVVLAGFFVPGVLFVVAGGRSRPIHALLAVSLLMLQMFCFLFIGIRSRALLPMMALTWVWHRALFRIPRWVFYGGAAFVLLVVFPLVSAIRATPGSYRSADAYVETWSQLENPLVATLGEAGNSLLTVAWTYVLVPEVRGFGFGSSFLNAIGFLLNPVYNLLNLAGYQIKLPSENMLGNWLFREVNPEAADQGGSLDYSLIAEAYFNFAWAGPTLLMLLIGYYYGRLVVWGLHGDRPERLACVAVVATFIIFFARTESLYLIRLMLQYAFLPYLVVCFLDRRWQRMAARKAG